MAFINFCFFLFLWVSKFPTSCLFFSIGSYHKLLRKNIKFQGEEALYLNLVWIKKMWNSHLSKFVIISTVYNYRDISRWILSSKSAYLKFAHTSKFRSMFFENVETTCMDNVTIRSWFWCIAIHLIIYACIPVKDHRCLDKRFCTRVCPFECPSTPRWINRTLICLYGNYRLYALTVCWKEERNR